MASASTILCIHRDPVQLNLLQENGYELVTTTNQTRHNKPHTVVCVPGKLREGVSRHRANALQSETEKKNMPGYGYCDLSKLTSSEVFAVQTRSKPIAQS